MLIGKYRTVGSAILGSLMLLMIPAAHSADHVWTEFNAIDKIFSLKGGRALYIGFVVPNTVNPSSCTNFEVMAFRFQGVDNFGRTRPLIDTSNETQIRQIIGAAETGKNIRFLISGVECGTTLGALANIIGLERQY